MQQCSNAANSMMFSFFFSISLAAKFFYACNLLKLNNKKNRLAAVFQVFENEVFIFAAMWNI
jgi:hypothetical protein